MPNKQQGAVDLSECPHPAGRYQRGCRCGKCAACGLQKHTAIHGPLLGQPPGSKPWGHEYRPATPEDRP